MEKWSAAATLPLLLPLFTLPFIFLASFGVVAESRASDSTFEYFFPDVTGPKLHKEFRLLETSESGIPLHGSELIISERAGRRSRRRRHHRLPPPSPIANPPISPVSDSNSVLESKV